MGKGKIVIYTYWCEVCEEDAQRQRGDQRGSTGLPVFDQRTADEAMRLEGWTIRGKQAWCPAHKPGQKPRNTSRST